MAVLSKVANILLFIVVSVIFLPLVGIVHGFYGSWEKWFESIAKS